VLASADAVREWDVFAAMHESGSGPEAKSGRTAKWSGCRVDRKSLTGFQNGAFETPRRH